MKKIRKASLAERVIALIEGARQNVATVANVAQVYTNYEIVKPFCEIPSFTLGWSRNMLLSLLGVSEYGRCAA